MLKRIMPMASTKTLIQRLLNLLFPPRCAGCGAVGAFLCLRCLASVPFVNSRTCLFCHRPQVNGAACYDCRQQPSALVAAAALCYYAPPVEAAIKRLKYKGGQVVAPTLAALVANHRLPTWLRPDAATLLLPVPLHPARERERGFNQAALLAAALAPHLDLPCDPHPAYLRRVRRTRPQVGLNHEQRRENVAGAFACDLVPAIHDAHIVLVDDVYTTGATMQDCARALREAGAARVYAFTIARARHTASKALAGLHNKAN
jgi:ComF family protein